MKTLLRTSASLCVVCVFVLAGLPRVMGDPAPAGNAKALMEEARKKQADRKRAEMQKELDRVAEDVKKGSQELDELEGSMSKVGYAVAETKAQMDRVAGRKKRVMQDMELLPLRIEAERLKEEALNLLNAAHSKTADAVKRQKEVLDLKAALVTAQIHKLEDAAVGAEPGARGTSGPTLTELRKNLEKAAGRSALAAERAREAMDAADARLRQADAASAKADKKQAEIDKENTPAAPGAPEEDKAKSKSSR